MIFSLFLIGFILGVFYTNIIGKDYALMNGFFSNYYLEQYREATIQVKSFAVYLLFLRISPLVVLLLFSITVIHKWIAGGIVLWTGFTTGVFISTGILQMGIKGIILGVVAGFPHMLCYLPVYGLGIWYTYYYPEIKWTKKKVAMILAGLGIGLVLELYVNPHILRWFIGIL